MSLRLRPQTLLCPTDRGEQWEDKTPHRVSGGTQHRIHRPHLGVEGCEIDATRKTRKTKYPPDGSPTASHTAPSGGRCFRNLMQILVGGIGCRCWRLSDFSLSMLQPVGTDVVRQTHCRAGRCGHRATVIYSWQSTRSADTMVTQWHQQIYIS